MVSFTVPKSHDADSRKVSIRTDSVGNWMTNMTTKPYKLYSRQKVAGDGNCMFIALASAAEIKNVKHTAKIDKVRLDVVEVVRNAMVAWTPDDRINFDTRIAGEYYPVFHEGSPRKVWRVYEVPGLKELKKRRLDAHGKDGYDVQVDAAIMMEHGIAVNCGGAWLDYMSCTGRNKDPRIAVQFHYTGKGQVYHIDERKMAVFGDDIAIQYAPKAMNADVWVYSCTECETAKDDMLVSYNTRQLRRRHFRFCTFTCVDYTTNG